MRRYGLWDDQFSRIENFLPGRPGSVGRDSQLGNRVFVEAVIWKFRSGAPWRDLPERFGNRLLTLKSLKGYSRLELPLVLLACRHR
jgi:transposase